MIYDKKSSKSSKQLATSSISIFLLFFPPFLWLLRDFVVDLTADGKAVSEHEYMEKALAERPPSA